MAEVKPLKNFLSICLGITLRKMRSELRLTYDDVFLKTDIKNSYFQAIELGNSIFHVSKAYALYDLFQAAYPKSLTGFIELLSIIAIIETRGVAYTESYIQECGKKGVKPTIEDKNKAYQQGLKKGFSEMGKANPKYQKLYLELRHAGLMDTPGTSNELLVEIIESKNTTAELLSFISDYMSYGELVGNKANAAISNLIDDVPTMRLDIIEGLKKSILLLPAHSLTSNELMHWEMAHADEITELTFVTSLEFFSSKLYQELYFPSFVHPSFKKASFYITGKKQTAEWYLDHFKLQLEKTYKTINKLSLLFPLQWPLMEPKLKFGHYEHNKVISALFSSNGIKSSNAFWIYSMSDDTQVAFTAFGDEDIALEDRPATFHISNLTVKDLQEKREFINQFQSDTENLDTEN